MPQVRNTTERFVSQVIPDTRTVIRTRPLEALIIGSYVRGLSDRDVESLAEEAGLGHVSKSTVSRICHELRDRYTAFCNKSLADLNVLALFLDAIYLPTRPSGQKEGVLVAWGYTTEGQRVLVAVRLGQRESHEDWLDLGRDLTRRGLCTPWFVVSDGAPGLIKAIEELWSEAERGRCAVHKLRNVVAKLPKRSGLHDEVKAALLGSTGRSHRPGRCRTAVARTGCRTGAVVSKRSGLPGRGLAGAVYPSQVFPATAQAVPLLEPVGAFVGGCATPDEGDRTLSRRNKLPEHVLGGARPVPSRGERPWLERPGV